MKHTEDLHIQHKVNEEYTKNALKTENRRNRASPQRTRRGDWSWPGGTERSLKSNSELRRKS